MNVNVEELRPEELNPEVTQKIVMSVLNTIYPHKNTANMAATLARKVQTVPVYNAKFRNFVELYREYEASQKIANSTEKALG